MKTQNCPQCAKATGFSVWERLNIGYKKPKPCKTCGVNLYASLWEIFSILPAALIPLLFIHNALPKMAAGVIMVSITFFIIAVFMPLNTKPDPTV